MKDTQIKGNGKSKILKAPVDMPETFEEWRTQLLNGNATLDIGLNESGCDVIGTPINKANLLSDNTSNAMNLDTEEPTVNDALSKLNSVKSPKDNPTFTGILKVKGVEDGVYNPITEIETLDNEIRITYKTDIIPLPPSLGIGDTLIHYMDGMSYQVYSEGNPPPVDTLMSATSENPVQNKVVKNAIDAITVNVGSYTGNGSEYQSISLPKKPKWVLVLHRGCATYTYSSADGAIYYGGLALVDKPVKASNELVVEITNTGFNVYDSGESTSSIRIKANESNIVYHYIWG